MSHLRIPLRIAASHALARIPSHAGEATHALAIAHFNRDNLWSALHSACAAMAEYKGTRWDCGRLVEAPISSVTINRDTAKRELAYYQRAVGVVGAFAYLGGA